MFPLELELPVIPPNPLAEYAAFPTPFATLVNQLCPSAVVLTSTFFLFVGTKGVPFLGDLITVSTPPLVVTTTFSGVVL